MIHTLTPYPAYKDSGVPWLGEVPAHWEVVPSRALFTEVNERNYPTEQLLSVTISKGVILQADLISNSSKKDSSNEDKSNYKLVRSGDIVYNKMRAWQGAVGVSQFRGIVSPAYVVVHPRNKQNPNYFHYLLRTPSFAKEAERWSYGITSDQWSLRPEHFKMIYCSLPPLSEQSAIVRYLDYMDRRIRRYIHSKQKLIKLLEEQKQAIIHRAVTRGLDPDVRLKDSGVEWLGDVPEHWEVLPLRRVTLDRCDGPFGSGLKSSHYTDNGIRVVRLTNIGHAEFKDSDAAFISPKHYATLGDHSVKVNDVLIAGLGDESHPAGRGCVAPRGIEPSLVKADCFRFRLNENRIHPQFAALHLTATAVNASGILSTGATRQRINLQSTSGRAITIPPLSEQKIILAYISEKTASLKVVIEHTHSEISLLREYRTRLISDVVTGKLDVREAAANLAVETEDEETLEDETEEIKENLDNEIENIEND